MIHIFNNKKGVTVLEGLIALGLLALVATGTFSVLLSVSRKSTNPDMREEMIYAVEKANNLLQGYILHQKNSTDSFSSVTKSNVNSVSFTDETPYSYSVSNSTLLTNDFSSGLCGNSNVYTQTDTTPLEANRDHHIECLLPPICDRNKSSFIYRVAVIKQTTAEMPASIKGAFESEAYVDNANNRQLQIRYTINCNGFTL